MDQKVTNKTVKVTIGIPVYNAQKFIAQALCSVLNQTFSDFELIITDDGSTDKTIEIIQMFKDPRIQLISDSKNLGISARLNQQISLAKGEYFFRMDADDLMFEDRIEKQVAYLEAHPEMDVVGSPVVIINDENEVIGLRKHNAQHSYQEALHEITFVHPTVGGKIDWFRKYGYDENLNGAEDFDLWLRSLEHSKFWDMEEPLLFYRDPLKFKLSTYLFRMGQLRKIFWKDKFLNKHLFLKYKIIGITYAKGFVAIFLNVIGKDSVFIKRRNNPKENITELKKYQAILNALILKNSENSN